MSSNFLRTVREHLKDAIKPNLPTRWRIFPTLTAPAKLAVPAVYFEFIEISNEMAARRWPRATSRPTLSWPSSSPRPPRPRPRTTPKPRSWI